MKLEEAFEKVDRIRIDFFDSKYKDVHTEDELAEKYEALSIILQYIKYDSIPKKKIEDRIKDIEKLKLNSKDYYRSNYFINCEMRHLQELLEDK